MPRHKAYLAEARRLRLKYADRLDIVIGFEGEWIRPGCGPLVESLASHPDVDYFIGSIHHTRGVPIDFDASYYAAAVAAAGGTEEALYASYYDEQHEMLTALRPRIVGHFDLVRLMSAQPGRSLRGWDEGRVWERVVRNLQAARSCGAWLECNTSALRKGLAEPYPSREIAEVSSLGHNYTSLHLNSLVLFPSKKKTSSFPGYFSLMPLERRSGSG